MRSLTTRSLVCLAAAGLAASAWAAPRRSLRPEKAERRAIVVDEPKRGGGQDPEEQQGQQAFTHYQFANQFFSQGLLKQAQEELVRSLSIQPAYPEASYLLGLVLLELNDYRGAMAEADRALSQNPFLTEAHNLMGMAHARMGDFDSALREFEIVKADISFPTPEVAHFNIAKVFWERQACGEAVLHFRRALEINPQFWRAWYLMGDCQENLGQIPQARESYGKALEIVPNEIGPLYRLGYLCFQEGNFACARQNLDRVREMSPASPEATGAREFIRQMNFR